MVYNPLIPIGEDSPADQAAQIRQNFASLASVLSQTIGGSVYNHTAFNNFNQGDHESIIFQKQTADPGVELNLNVLFAKDVVSASSTEPQLFVQIPQFVPNNKPNTPMQLTFNTVNTAGPIYQSFLPGGYLLFFGNVSNFVPITLTPTPSEILIAIAQTNTNTSFDVSVKVTQPDKVQIFSAIAAGVFTFSWLAIAKA